MPPVHLLSVESSGALLSVIGIIDLTYAILKREIAQRSEHHHALIGCRQSEGTLTRLHQGRGSCSGYTFCVPVPLDTWDP
ncbi:hypothetical protein BDM02DRAFT_3109205 [Thelephora ganbajun]|uniref:Uncharacterized protein n=1 Tax=Thelephora ganbajun TaxID=370292 RepID=A0ACB6ZT27_THEGA|nr:hypothetical protein BDM02DRAFT_3109205 [Thelephora ganbajun]